MSDDLISRKEAVELVIAEYDRFQSNGGSHSGRHELDKVIKMLQNMATAFDKKKVIEELKDAEDIPHDDSMAEITSTRIWNKAITKSIKIDEKGGIK